MAASTVALADTKLEIGFVYWGTHLKERAKLAPSLCCVVVALETSFCLLAFVFSSVLSGIASLSFSPYLGLLVELVSCVGILRFTSAFFRVPFSALIKVIWNGFGRLSNIAWCLITVHVLCLLVLLVLQSQGVHHWLNTTNLQRGDHIDWLLVLNLLVMAPVREELFFRLALFHAALARLASPLSAALLAGSMFAVVHLMNLASTRYSAQYTLVQLAVAFTLGTFYCLRVAAAAGAGAAPPPPPAPAAGAAPPPPPPPAAHPWPVVEHARRGGGSHTSTETVSSPQSPPAVAAVEPPGATATVAAAGSGGGSVGGSGGGLFEVLCLHIVNNACSCLLPSNQALGWLQCCAVVSTLIIYAAAIYHTHTELLRREHKL